MSNKKVKEKSKTTNAKMKSQFDYEGAYTGVDYEDKYAKPIQDADDL